MHLVFLKCIRKWSTRFSKIYPVHVIHFQFRASMYSRPRGHEFHNSDRWLHWHHNHAFNFIPMCGNTAENFWKCDPFLLTWPSQWSPGGGMVINFTIIPLILEMLQTKNGNHWPCNFQEEFINVKLLRHDTWWTTDEARQQTKTKCNRSPEQLKWPKIHNKYSLN